MFEIQRFETDYYNGKEREYKPGEELNVQVSAMAGLDSQPATLYSLPKGKGFVVYYKSGKQPKAVGSGSHIWTDKGYAVGL